VPQATGGDDYGRVVDTRPSESLWYETVKLNYGFNFAEQRGHYDRRRAGRREPERASDPDETGALQGEGVQHTVDEVADAGFEVIVANQADSGPDGGIASTREYAPWAYACEAYRSGADFGAV
jgi:hypothetical protein